MSNPQLGPLEWPVTQGRWLLAVSGGLDSMCLLHLVSQLQQNAPSFPPVEVIHVNHGLQDAADQWQQLVLEQCQGYGINCHVQTPTISAESIKQQGVEGAARLARYDAFAALMQADDVLLLGQHADDQTETFLLRLLRGAGVTGLSAMAQTRPLAIGSLHRPLLHTSRDQLQAYAQHHDLAWVEDPSNDDERFERNYLRHSVLPALRQRWPGLSQRVQTTSQIMAETEALLSELGAEDLLACEVEEAGVGVGLQVAKLMQLSPARRHNVLRYWLRGLGQEAPDYQQLQRFDDEVLLAKPDAQPQWQLPRGQVQRSYGVIYWLANDKPAEPMLDELIWQWSPDEQVKVPLAGGWLVPAAGGVGLNIGDTLSVSWRAGGERCQPMGRRHSQSLKKLLQEYQVPAWQRDQLPLVYVNGELAMVADVWINEGFGLAESAVGWRWQRC